MRSNGEISTLTYTVNIWTPTMGPALSLLFTRVNTIYVGLLLGGGLGSHSFHQNKYTAKMPSPWLWIRYHTKCSTEVISFGFHNQPQWARHSYYDHFVQKTTGASEDTVIGGSVGLETWHSRTLFLTQSHSVQSSSGSLEHTYNFCSDKGMLSSRGNQPGSDCRELTSRVGHGYSQHWIFGSL